MTDAATSCGSAAAAASTAAVAARLRAAGCVFAEDEAGLLLTAAGTAAELAALVERRVSGIPLEHVLGWAEFAGLRIEVDPGVFIPRRRSEFLVAEAVRVAAGGLRPEPDHPLVVADLCCGCGAIGVAVTAALGQAELHAADIDAAAVACARRNVATVGGQVYRGDLFDAFPAGLRRRVNLLVVNAPYVPASELGLMPAEARLHEPRLALDGGADGTGIHRRVAAGAAGWLARGGWLLIETSERQAPITAAAVRSGGMAAAVVTDDDLEATVVIGSAAR